MTSRHRGWGERDRGWWWSGGPMTHSSSQWAHGRLLAQQTCWNVAAATDGIPLFPSRLLCQCASEMRSQEKLFSYREVFFSKINNPSCYHCACDNMHISEFCSMGQKVTFYTLTYSVKFYTRGNTSVAIETVKKLQTNDSAFFWALEDVF